jgi:hypothetical protein
MGRWPSGDAPMTRAQRMARLRAKQPTASDLVSVRPEEMAAVILAQSGSAYCRELAKDLLLMAIWRGKAHRLGAGALGCPADGDRVVPVPNSPAGQSAPNA